MIFRGLGKGMGEGCFGGGANKTGWEYHGKGKIEKVMTPMLRSEPGEEGLWGWDRYV